MISTARLADVFVETADTLVNDFDLVDFLDRLTDHVAAVSGADAVGLVLADGHGALQFMAASNDAGKALELLQLQAIEGPCLDAFTTRQPVVNADLGSASDVWPDFAPRARAAGFVSVHAFPMRLRDDVIGALNLFGRGAVRFSADEVRVVQSLADVATIAILQERSIAQAGVLGGPAPGRSQQPHRDRTGQGGAVSDGRRVRRRGLRPPARAGSAQSHATRRRGPTILDA